MRTFCLFPLLFLCLTVLSASAVAEPLPGDINGDEEINAQDIQLVINDVLGLEIPAGSRSDVDGDGDVNAQDIQMVINVVLGVFEPPEARFEAEPVSGMAPLEVQFEDLSDGGTDSITDWHWDFGDGATSGEQNPVHVYEAAGAYTVSLRIETDRLSHRRIETDLVQVEAATAEPKPLPEDEAAKWIAPSVDVSQADADTSGNVTDTTATQVHHADGSSEYRVISAMDDPQALRSRIEARGTDDSLLGLYRYLGTVIFVNRIQDADGNIYLVLTTSGTGGVYETSLGSFTLPVESTSTNFGAHTIGPVNESQIAEIQADMPASITRVEDIPILVFEEFVSAKRGIGMSYPDNVRVKTVGDPRKFLGNMWDQMRRTTPDLVLDTVPGLRTVQQLTKTIQFAVRSARFALDVKRNLDPAAENLGDVRANYANADAPEGGVSLEALMAQHSELVDPSGEQTDVPLLAGSLLEGLSGEISHGSQSAVDGLGQALWGDGTGRSDRLRNLVDDIDASAEVYFYRIPGQESGLYARAGSRDIKLAGSLLESVIATLTGDSDV
ncbi:MAG: PKD domain-containing protein, partial [Candidatus Hydrogenedentota bacterium]